MTVEKTFVHVKWNDQIIYEDDEDFDQALHYDGVYNYSVSWDIPSFAPSGEYNVTFTAYPN